MSGPVSDALAELIAMKASGDITSEEFIAARDRLRNGAGAPSGTGVAPLPQPPSAQVAAAATASPGAVAPKKPRRFRKTAAVIGVSFVALWIFGAINSQTTYKRGDYGAAWPYPRYDSATVRCKVRKFGSTDRPVATVELGGVTYGLNGAARGSGLYPDSAPLEAPDKMAIMSARQAMIDDALTNLCRWKQ